MFMLHFFRCLKMSKNEFLHKGLFSVLFDCIVFMYMVWLQKTYTQKGYTPKTYTDIGPSPIRPNDIILKIYYKNNVFQNLIHI